VSARQWATAFGVLAGTVLVHEIAHAVAARWAGGPVREVAVGFGPILARGRVGDTDVTLRAIPVGGFAAIDVAALPPSKRVQVLLAGPLANIASGLLLRRLAGRVEPMALPGQTRGVEVGGFLSALTMLRHASAAGTRTLVRAAGDLNLSVGLANLLPIVPLDGGHIAATRIEAAGAARGTVAAFRQISAAVFVWVALRVLLADLSRLHSNR
jgi:membrane-associated protease RseP (regulator of RpoE activity)